jgi:O-phosphoseryl-tRNA(Cys) synthetase
MFLVTWIEGEEVNYRLVKKQDLPRLMASFGQQHPIIQKFAS